MLKIRVMGDVAQLEQMKVELGQPWQRVYPNRGGNPDGRLYPELGCLETVRFLKAMKGAVKAKA